MLTHRRKQILPGQRAITVRRFACDRMGQLYPAAAALEISIVQGADRIKLPPHIVSYDLWQHRDALVTALAGAHHDLSAIQCDVLHAQLQRFQQSETRTIKQIRYQPLRARELLKYS